MPDVAGLLEVSPFIHRLPDDVSYRSCDVCFESALEDIWANRPYPWRAFYMDPQCGVNVCENCTAEYLTEKPTP